MRMVSIMQCASYKNICGEQSTFAADVSHFPSCLSTCTHSKVDRQSWLKKTAVDMRN